MIQSKNSNTQTGFALLEILLVVAAVAVLAGITVVILNPGRQLSNSRNSQRQADVAAILDAVDRYTSDKGALPSTITTQPTEICATGTDATGCTDLVDLSLITVSSQYISSSAIPKDPECGTKTVCAVHGTGYQISRDANNHITVVAPAAERHRHISATR